MRGLTSATQVATSAIVTQPIYLVEIAFSPVIRLSTLGDVEWNGQMWSGGQAIVVSGLSSDGRGGLSASLQVGNSDGAIGAIALGQGIADRSVKIWAGDAAALSAPEDMELVFVGAVRSADVDENRASFRLEAQGTRTMRVPRRVIGPESGFNYLIPAGSKMTIGTTTYTLERR